MIKLSEILNEETPIYKDWDEFVNPHHIIVHLKNGKKLKIDRSRVKGGNTAYHAILKAFNDNNYIITNKIVNAMMNNLGESVNEVKPKAIEYIITSIPASAIPGNMISRADVMLGLKMGGEFGMYSTLTNKDYKLDYENGKVALKLSNDGKRAIRVRSEKDPNYVNKIQKFANEFLSDYAKKLKKESVNEATTSWSKMMQDVRKGGSGPWSLVGIEYNKVVAQKNNIKDKNLLPAHFEAMRRENPKAKIHIEDGGGEVVWNEKR